VLAATFASRNFQMNDKMTMTLKKLLATIRQCVIAYQNIDTAIPLEEPTELLLIMDFAYDLSACIGLIPHHADYNKAVVSEQLMEVWDRDEPMKGAWKLLKPSEQTAVLNGFFQLANNPRSIHMPDPDTVQDLQTLLEQEWHITLIKTPRHCHADMYPSIIARRMVHNVLIAANRLNEEYQPIRPGLPIRPTKIQFVNLFIDRVKIISWEVALKVVLGQNYEILV
jgi:hypothetical protein